MRAGTEAPIKGHRVHWVENNNVRSLARSVYQGVSEVETLATFNSDTFVARKVRFQTVDRRELGIVSGSDRISEPKRGTLHGYEVNLVRGYRGYRSVNDQAVPIGDGRRWRCEMLYVAHMVALIVHCP